MVADGRAEKVDTRDGPNTAAAYPRWHPSGKLLAFSRNSFTQIFHSAGVETREVVDRDSDLGLYRTDTNEVFTVPQISRPDRLETWPSWSPDGRYLYFCSRAPVDGPEERPAYCTTRCATTWSESPTIPPPAGGARWKRWSPPRSWARASRCRNLARRALPDVHCPRLRQLPHLPALERPVPAGLERRPVRDGSTRSTPTAPIPIIPGPATAAGSSSPLSGKTACSPGSTSPTSKPAAGSASPS